MFVVVDFNKDKAIWIDQHGQVLQYDQQLQTTLNQPYNVVQHSKGPLLSTDRGNNRVLVVSSRGDLLSKSLLQNVDIKLSGILHLDELAGFLCVCCKFEYDREVNIFQFLPCAERTKLISLYIKHE